MNHAVISDYTDDYYHIQSNDVKVIMRAPTIQNLHQTMEKHGIDVLWAMPGCPFSRTIRKEHFEELDSTQFSVYVPEHLVKNRIYGVRVTSKIRGSHGELAPDRFFMFPENREWKVPKDKDKGIWHVETPQDLLQTVQIIEREYGYCLWGPSYIGLHYLKALLQRQDKILVGLSERQHKEYDKITRQMVHPVAWASLHTKGKYLHWLDKNGWYLGGAQSVELGNGAYDIVTKMVKDYPFPAAFYEYKLIEWDNPRLPCPLAKEGYAHVDLIKAAHKAGAKLDVYGGIVWMESQKYLSQWAKDMWQKRANLNWKNVYLDTTDEIASKNAASTAKMIPNTMMGRLRNEGLAHWNDAIIHRAMTNQMYTLLRLYRDEEIAPVMVSKDALFFVSDEQDAHKALPSMLEYEQEQRGYKLVGTCEMTPEIEQAFSSSVNGLEATIRKAMKG